MTNSATSIRSGSVNASADPAHDNVIAGSKWEFDSAVAKCFDQMLARSIPSYEVMRMLTEDLTVAHLNSLDRSDVPVAKRVLDLGASRGGAIAAMVPRVVNTRFLALEISDPMLHEMSLRFAATNSVQVQKYDLRDATPGLDSGVFRRESADVVLIVLTLQFVALEHRHKIMQAVYDSLRPGGLLVYVEKILGSSHRINETQVDHYYEMKRAHGYSQEEIDSKRLSLEGVLVPLAYDWHIELMRSAGFRQIDSYFRHLNFCGFMAYK